MAENFFYHGSVNVFLQGQRALRVDEQNPGYLVCHLGSKDTRIRIRDFRPNPRRVANAIFRGEPTMPFKDLFCQPASAKIEHKRGRVSD